MDYSHCITVFKMTKEQIISNINGIKAQCDMMLVALDYSQKYLTSKEACQLLSVCHATMSRLARQYKLKYPKIKGHKCYLKESVMKLLEVKESNKIQFKES